MLFTIVACAGVVVAAGAGEPASRQTYDDGPPFHMEMPDDPDAPPPVIPGERATSPAGRSVLGTYVSVQVNVNALGLNTVGDAANEPSIAVDPTNPNRIAIGWRQFDTILSNFRQAGVGYSQDGGHTWTFPDVLDRGTFRSDPVLEFDAEGNFYYLSLYVPGGLFLCDVFKSQDGGATWGSPFFAFGGDKAWLTIDRTEGIGRGNIYQAWSVSAGCCGEATFSRLTPDGQIFSTPTIIPLSPRWGTLSVGPDGELYIAGIGSSGGIAVIRSSNAQDSDATPVFELATNVNLGGSIQFGGGPNPGGLMGQVWVATDHSNSQTRGNVYLLASVLASDSDPLDVMFARSTDGGETWSEPIRVNDDPVGNGAWQWFGTMSVAPNGRIDVVWNDTRDTFAYFLSELFYSYSTDGGLTWSENVPVSEVFNSLEGWPSQNKLGDYYDMISDDLGVSVAYAATFNGEQDVYYLRIGEFDCNNNGTGDSEDIADGTSDDCNDNSVPDECEPDCNDNGTADPCDITNQTSGDCNGNIIPDECEADFDGDGLIDACDPDSDNDGVPNDADDCPFTPLDTPVQDNGRPVGDTNGDCALDLTDYGRLQRCIKNGGPDTLVDSEGCLETFDFDGDGYLDLDDFAGFQNFFTGSD
jgi:hypothetical protein